jgi:oligosaccharide repeat unit polymerase
MADTYLLLLTSLLAGILVHALMSPKRIYEYPYFMAAAFIAFILPQAYSLVRFPAGAQPEAIDTVLLMALLCVLACMVGYRAPLNRWIVEKTQIPIDDRQLFRWGVFFVLCGFFFTALISQMTYEERGGSQWTGRATIFLFFATLGYPGLAICLRQALKNRQDGVAWFWAIAGFVIPVISCLFHARREPMALIALTTGLTFYFQKRYVLPRGLVAAALALATIVIPATSQIRSTLGTRGIAGVWNVDYVGNFQRFISGSSILELRNAAILVQATNRTGDFGFGEAYWDQLVFRFVPAQIVGGDFKDSLMFRSPKRRDKEEIAIVGYRRQTGTTVTGIGDAYREFGYFGALFFAALAVVFKSLWAASLRPDGVFAQLLYIQTSTSAMHAVTHQTADYLPALFYNLIFLGAAVYFSRVRRPTATVTRTLARTQ